MPGAQFELCPNCGNPPGERKTFYWSCEICLEEVCEPISVIIRSEYLPRDRDGEIIIRLSRVKMFIQARRMYYSTIEVTREEAETAIANITKELVWQFPEMRTSCPLPKGDA